jgi:hypothetical protein
MLSFHKSRLKKYIDTDNVKPLDIAIMDSDSYVVDHIVEHFYNKNTPSNMKFWKFKVHWLGFDAEEDSLLSFSSIKDLAAFDDFLKEHPEHKHLSKFVSK